MFEGSTKLVITSYLFSIQIFHCLDIFHSYLNSCTWGLSIGDCWWRWLCETAGHEKKWTELRFKTWGKSHDCIVSPKIGIATGSYSPQSHHSHFIGLPQGSTPGEYVGEPNTRTWNGFFAPQGRGKISRDCFRINESGVGIYGNIFCWSGDFVSPNYPTPGRNCQLCSLYVTVLLVGLGVDSWGMPT